MPSGTIRIDFPFGPGVQLIGASEVPAVTARYGPFQIALAIGANNHDREDVGLAVSANPDHDTLLVCITEQRTCPVPALPRVVDPGPFINQVETFF